MAKDEKEKEQEGAGDAGDSGAAGAGDSAGASGDSSGDQSGSLDAESLLEDNRRKNKENESLRERLRSTEAELEQLREQNMSEAEKAIEKARKEGRQEAESHYKMELAKEKVRRVAAPYFNDPDDALMYVDLDKLDVSKEDNIVDALNEVLDAKPYLAKKNAGNGRGSIDQGYQGDTGGGSNVGGDSASDWLRSIAGRR